MYPWHKVYVRYIYCGNNVGMEDTQYRFENQVYLLIHLSTYIVTISLARG